MQVDPLLGGEVAFRDFVNACHARGMKVVLDGVFNHTGRGHWAFTNLLDAQEQSPYRDWFLPKSFPVRAYDVERYCVNYECWWDLPDLPKLNFQNEGVQQHILDVGEYWVKEFGIDGWRLDYPIEIPPVFWKEFRERCRAVDPSCVTVGELFGVRPQDVGEGGHFDSLMNYAFGTCAMGFTGGDIELRQDDAIGGEYEVNALDAPGFRREFGEVCNAYMSAHSDTAPGLGAGSAHPSMLMNLFDSHDTARALWMLRGDGAALRLLLLMQACAPGPPMIFQGTEVGQVGQLGLEGSGRDPHNRQAFPWHEPETWDRTTLEHTKAVGALRAAHEVLRRGGLRWCKATRAEDGKEDEENNYLLVWERFFDNAADGASALCLFHSGRGYPTGMMKVETGFGPGVALRAVFDTSGAITQTVITDDQGYVRVELEPQGGLVLIPA